jgi:Zn-dependent protease with chaperone function
MSYEPWHYQHPSDRESLIHLRAVQWFETLSKHLVAEDLERDAHLLNVIDNVRMTRQDFPRPNQYLENACHVLGVSPLPCMFLDTNPEPQIQSLGERQPMMVISSGLLELLSEEELEAAIAHEVGHLASRHSYYKLLAQHFDALVHLGSALPFGNIALFAVKVPLYDWYRKADLTADRAAFLVMRKVDPILKMIGKIAGGSSKVGGAISLETLLAQAREVEQSLEEVRSATFRERTSFMFSSMIMQGIVRAQPWPTFRVLEITRWAASPYAADLLSGKLPDKPPLEEDPKAATSSMKEWATTARKLGQSVWSKRRPL